MASIMFYIVYQTTNLVNGKIYVGQHQTTDLNDGYLGSGTSLKKAISRYGRENFKIDILHVFDNQKEMRDKEREIVTEEFVARKDTYNLCIGGTGGPLRKGAVLTEKTKRKISEKTKEAMKCESIKKRLSEKRRERKTKQETRDLMSKNRKDKVWMKNEKTREKKHVHTEQVDLLLSKGWKRGRFFGDECNPMKNREASQKNARKRMKPVYAYGTVYESRKSAAKGIGCAESHVKKLADDPKTKEVYWASLSG